MRNRKTGLKLRRHKIFTKELALIFWNLSVNENQKNKISTIFNEAKSEILNLLSEKQKNTLSPEFYNKLIERVKKVKLDLTGSQREEFTGEFKCASDFNLRGTTSRAQPNELLGLCICRSWPHGNLSVSLST